MFIASKLELWEHDQESKKIILESLPILGFSEKDKAGTFQPHDNAFMVTLQIGGYDVKRVLVD